MINFFRKTRKKMADDNKFLKYSRYAVGEIALVMIGILLALQVNNWNEERKVLKFEQEILRDLKIEITSNIKRLEMATSMNRKSLKNAKLLDTLYQNPELRNQYSDFSTFKLTWQLSGNVFELDDGILNSIISSGQIKSIKNKELKYKLASLRQVTQRNIRFTKKVESDGMEYFDRIILPKLATGIENGKIIMTYKNMFKIPEFPIAIHGTYIERRKLAIGKEERLKIFYEEILTLINREIDSE